MRPPWLGRSREEAELEALQTDIMRFMAILGLCLAAIFSLVQGAAQEQLTAVEQAGLQPTTFKQTTAEQVTIEKRPVEQAIEPVPPTPKAPAAIIVPGPPVVGFTLEFASVRALETLLQSGKVQLYARQGDQFLSVDTHGIAVPVATPSSYYQMHTETVPQRLRDSLHDTSIGGGITWGVTLPTEAIGQIQRLTTGRKGGNLLIGYDGVVTLEDT